LTQSGGRGDDGDYPSWNDKVIDFVFAFADFAIAASWSIGSAFPLRALAALPALQGFLLATTA
jgi:hypothetical protein